jgi:hypothetical protein
MIAKIGQYAENEYFKKPCGLMDQMASAVGGFVFIDFYLPDHPVVEKSILILKPVIVVSDEYGRISRESFGSIWFDAFGNEECRRIF